ncbi:MAG: DUF2959 domain-containing protein [Verrucomicrobiales bacterium]|nr:DUF2959 domain-containing protein [Verrucomicrobiales bacterium]MCP5527479.1 DUF2959 domain-containing protein [Verrucomicrobiales bacterium]
MRFTSFSALLAAAALLGAGCRSTYYAAYEQFGIHKRDLLKDRVEDARQEQAQASEQFKDALTRLQEMTGFNGGDLEQAYRKLQSDYDRCVDQADDVRSRIGAMNQVAEDLFTEWESELEEITTPSLRADSRRKLQDTRLRYAALYRSLNQAERSMEPVLVRFKDYVLYLKHNLNAQAVASLQGEAVDIQAEIQSLIDQMNASIAEADRFVADL